MTRFVAAPGRVGALILCCLLTGPISAQAPHGHDHVEPGPATTSSEPVIGRIQVFDDWAVGCDNRLTCSAVSLVPDGAGTAYNVLVSIQRTGGPEGAAVIRMMGADQLRGKIELFADNRRLMRATAAKDMIEVTGTPGMNLIRALGSSYAFELRDKKSLLGTPSLRGLPAALRYIDQQQGRVGSQAALAALGEGPADLAKAVPPELPVLPAARGASEATLPAFSDAEQAAARRLAVCESGPDSGHPLETYGLDEGHALVLLPCNAGAYNVSAVPLVATGGAGHWQFQVARFDHVPGFTGEPGAPPLIVNARWNPVRGELSSFAKGRGLGDCGTAEIYRWDGAQFRLAEARSMPVCRGAWEWPVLYSVTAQG